MNQHNPAQSNPSRHEVYQQMTTILSKHARAGATAITPDSHIQRDLKVNSARFVDVLLDIEDAFGVQINSAAADNIVTVGDAVDVVCESQS